jgi:epoxyqueuosine reductase
MVGINASKQADQPFDGPILLKSVQDWAIDLGFSQIGVADVHLTSAEAGLQSWLSQGFHGSMGYMAAHGMKRARPAELVPGTVRVITARMNYLPRDVDLQTWREREWRRLASPTSAIISVYARGRDYHKVMRQRLQQLADRLADAAGPMGHRVFVDSAPVLECELAARSGQGWRGKHTLVLNREAGSMFFLGEIYTDLALPLTDAVPAHCGTCEACLRACPTGAIVAPYRLDARRCISYLTIEHEGPIPVDLRPLLGNRIYGCDDCQLACPWNKYAQRAELPDFDTRHGLDHAGLLALWAWDEATFLRRTEGSAIRRIGYVRWQRNIAVALGNALRAGGTAERDEITERLSLRRPRTTAMVAEHIDWALAQPPDATR